MPGGEVAEEEEGELVEEGEAGEVGGVLACGFEDDEELLFEAGKGGGCCQLGGRRGVKGERERGREEGREG